MPKRKGNKTEGSDDQIKQTSDNERSWLSPISFSSSTSHDAFLSEHPGGTLPPLTLSPSLEHDSNQSVSKWDLSPDEFGQPLTKDMLKKKDKIDQVADKLLQDQLQRRKRGKSLDMSYLDKRHSDDELVHVKDTIFERGGYTSDGRASLNLSSRPSSPKSSRRSSLFRSDESAILKSLNKNLGSDTNQTMTINKSRHDRVALEDLPDDDSLWLQVPTLASSKTGLKAWLYRSVSRCVNSRGCETGDLLLDLTTDEILQVAHNVRALYDFRNRVVLEQALKREDASRLRENSLSDRGKRYAASVLSMATTVSNWDEVELKRRLSFGKDNDQQLQFDVQSKKSLDGAVHNSVSSGQLSPSATPPRSPPGSARSSYVERGSDTFLYSNETYQPDPRISFTTAERPYTADKAVPKIVQLGISDEDTDMEVNRPYLRFENTALHFVSRTNRFRLYLWRILGKWYVWFCNKCLGITQN